MTAAPAPKSPVARLETLQLETGPAPTACVIWLHGLGADANDFVPMVPELRLDSARCGDVRFVFPNAPVMPVTINGGYPMRAWYDIVGSDLVRREDRAGLQRSRDSIDALIDEQIAAGLPPSRIVLAGFSQGCAMTLLTGLRRSQPLAGLVALSGYLPLADEAIVPSAAMATMPILLAHGRFDDVVPLARGAATRDRLIALGHAVQWHDYPMAHAVCEAEIDAIGRFLERVLART